MWRPIKTAPKNDYVLAADGATVGEAVWRDDMKRWQWMNGLPADPTHWMPLPRPPQDSGGWGTAR